MTRNSAAARSFDAEHPRGRGGQFTEKTRPEPTTALRLVPDPVEVAGPARDARTGRAAEPCGLPGGCAGFECQPCADSFYRERAASGRHDPGPRVANLPYEGPLPEDRWEPPTESEILDRGDRDAGYWD